MTNKERNIIYAFSSLMLIGGIALSWKGLSNLTNTDVPKKKKPVGFLMMIGGVAIAVAGVSLGLRYQKN